MKSYLGTAFLALAVFVGGPNPAVAQDGAASAPETLNRLAAPDKRGRGSNPFTHFFQNLGRDLKALPSERSVVYLVLGGAASLGAYRYDDNFRNWAVNRPDAPFTRLGNIYGDGWAQAGGSMAVWAIGKGFKRPAAEHLGADLIRAQAVNGVLTVALKRTVDRTRPDQGRHSFPSGHTSAALATATVVQGHYGMKAAAPFYALGGIVAWSRARSNRHWLSDTAFGAAIGMTSGLAVTRGFFGGGRIAVTPVKIRGGVAFYVTAEP
jgi:membrane-associated phospholipid phosphatase